MGDTRISSLSREFSNVEQGSADAKSGRLVQDTPIGAISSFPLLESKLTPFAEAYPHIGKAAAPHVLL